LLIAVICSESFASVESVKAASDVYSPVSGKVIEVNKEITANTALVNESAEDKAWFVKLGKCASLHVIANCQQTVIICLMTVQSFPSLRRQSLCWIPLHTKHSATPRSTKQMNGLNMEIVSGQQFK
jgi:hypothetical protein